MTEAVVDVRVLGGGPAGCAAARWLALWGHNVVLISPDDRAASPLPESIPPSAHKLFQLLGVGERMADAGFIRSSGHTVWWGGGEARLEYFADDERGWHVTSDRLSALLRASAKDAGVHFDNGRARSGDTGARRSTFTLDCTGRSGVLAHARGMRVLDADRRTVALIARWQPRRAFALPDPSHTLIESYDDGWAWSVPIEAADRYVAVMIDPERSALAKRSDASTVYLREIDKTRQLRAVLARADATVDGRPAGWDASTYHAQRYVDNDVLLVGDAGSFVDPLSSAGVKKALASGWLAAVAVHTSLVQPGLRSVALDFFAAREVEMASALQAMTTDALTDAAAGHERPFWRDRSEARAPTDDERDAIIRAFDHLRRQPDLHLVRNQASRVELRPAVVGHMIALVPHLVEADGGAGARHVWDVDLLTLVELAPLHVSVSDLMAAYERQRRPVPAPDFLRALSQLLARGHLRWAGR